MAEAHRTLSVRLLQARSDDRLVALASEGDKPAFEAIVRRHHDPLLRYARRLLPAARAEDAVQQSLFAAWMALQRGAEVHGVKPWLYRIVRNTAFRMLEAPGYDYAQLSESLQTPETAADCAERKAALSGTVADLSRLPPLQRAALVQTSIEGLSHSQVASALGLSDKAVRGLVYRARTRLRAAAGALAPWPLFARLARIGRGYALSGGQRNPAELASGAGALAVVTRGGAVVVATGILAAGGAAVGPILAGHANHSRRASRAAAPSPHAVVVAASGGTARPGAAAAGSLGNAIRVRRPREAKRTSGAPALSLSVVNASTPAFHAGPSAPTPPSGASTPAPQPAPAVSRADPVSASAAAADTNGRSSDPEAGEAARAGEAAPGGEPSDEGPVNATATTDSAPSSAGVAPTEAGARTAASGGEPPGEIAAASESGGG